MNFNIALFVFSCAMFVSGASGFYRKDYGRDVDIDQEKTVVCPEYSIETNTYCDCDSDCTGEPQWCSCPEAQDCCKTKEADNLEGFGIQNLETNNPFSKIVEGGINSNPISSGFNSAGIHNDATGKCGLIVIHALSVPLSFPEVWYKSRLGGLGVRKDCIIKNPIARFTKNVALMEAGFGLITAFIPSKVNPIRSWFDFWYVPAIGPVKDSTEELEISLNQIEETIEELISEGVEPSNIVVTGISQGGALTLHTAVHTKYKLGGFVPIVGWLPQYKNDVINNLQSYPVNKDTPILHVNGMMDPLVPWMTAAKGTEQEMQKVFTQYRLEGIFGATHGTTINPVSTPMIRKFLREKTTIGS